MAARLRATLVLALVALVAVLPAGRAVAGGYGDDRPITVMTRNLYLGSDLTNLATADADDFVAFVTKDWNNVVNNDFPRRAEALAAEIQITRPDVIGLQEVSLFQDQETGEIDYLKILLGELAERGLSYREVATSTNASFAAPRYNNAGTGLSIVSLTDRDVILVRSSLTGRVSNAQNGNYATYLPVP